MVKILRIITRLNIGGPAIHAILLSSALNRNGYKDILVCGEPSESEGNMHYLAKKENIEPLVISSLRRDISLMRDLKAFMQLYSILKREKPEIIHTHTAKAGALGRLAAILAGVPVKIHTFHGHIFDGYFSPSRARLFTLIEKFLGLFTDKIVIVSDTVKNDMVEKLKVADRAKSVVIPLGLELEKFLHSEEKKGIFRKTMGLPNAAFLIGIVGRLVPIKNHRMFLDAAKVVLDKKIDKEIKFIVVGDGELKETLKAYATDIGIMRQVMFTGWVEDIASVYADLDIVALTSLNEGTPVSLIEAMASAKPVIATAVGGIRDLIRENENGLLAKSNDVEDFSAKLSVLLKGDDMRIKFGTRGREFVKDRYSKDRLVKDIENLYEECLAKERR